MSFVYYASQGCLSLEFASVYIHTFVSGRGTQLVDIDLVCMRGLMCIRVQLIGFDVGGLMER